MFPIVRVPDKTHYVTLRNVSERSTAECNHARRSPQVAPLFSASAYREGVDRVARIDVAQGKGGVGARPGTHPGLCAALRTLPACRCRHVGSAAADE